MTEWLKKRFEKLLEYYDHKSFGFEDALSALSEAFGDDETTVKKVLSELKAEDLIEVTPSQTDRRKKLYKVKETESVKDITSKGELEALLKRATDTIRNRVDYTFLLVILFYKAISDKWEKEYTDRVNRYVSEGKPRPVAEKLAKLKHLHNFVVPEEHLWKNVMSSENPVAALMEALNAIAKANPQLAGVINRNEFVDFLRSEDNRATILQLLYMFDALNFADFSTDLLGDAYEYILRNFAPEKAKQGEIYTPREVIELMVDIIEPKPGQSVYDPACGSGGMLIAVDKYLKNHYEDEREKTKLYGQEVNTVTAALARMNLFIHDISTERVKIEEGDTLRNSKFIENGKLMKFDIVIANPPWNLKGIDPGDLASSPMADERFKYGYTTKSSADWAWIQHMLASSTGKNKIAVVFDTGLLFRGSREKAIRKAILEEDLIETIILLPEKLFYNTSAPGVIIILNKNKAEDRKGKVLFINASELYAPHPTVRKLNTITPEQRAKIAEHAIDWKEEPHFAKIVDIKEIKKNDYNLSVQRYVFPKIEVEEIDIASEWKKIEDLTEKESKLRQKIEEYLRDIGIRG
ncbi:N-6 DNA methylase [bacterium 3DAC]|nr:N-6 DNA methylase [bacterium 3DAC]